MLSCEKRSLLTDYEWVRQIGAGAFGRAHLVVNRYNGAPRVVKLVMSAAGAGGGGDDDAAPSDKHKRDVKETELHQNQ